MFTRTHALKARTHTHAHAHAHAHAHTHTHTHTHTHYDKDLHPHDKCFGLLTENTTAKLGLDLAKLIGQGYYSCYDQRKVYTQIGLQKYTHAYGKTHADRHKYTQTHTTVLCPTRSSSPADYLLLSTNNTRDNSKRLSHVSTRTRVYAN